MQISHHDFHSTMFFNQHRDWVYGETKTNLMHNEFDKQINSEQFFDEHTLENSQPFTVEGHAPANRQIITKIIPTAGQNISGQITIQMNQMKISEFKYQEKPISFYHLDDGQMERSFGHNGGNFCGSS